MPKIASDMVGGPSGTGSLLLRAGHEPCSPPLGELCRQRKRRPNRYPTPKKTRITTATTAATRAIIESSWEPAPRSMPESSQKRHRDSASGQSSPSGRDRVVRARHQHDALGRFGGECRGPSQRRPEARLPPPPGATPPPA